MKHIIIPLGALLYLLLCPGFPTAAMAMRTITQEGVFLHYPQAEDAIATTLIQELPDMLAFLRDKGVPVSTPLHIVLDDRLDAPRVIVTMIPHREIRIPLKAPGVLEDGYLEADPWTYFLFRGLSLQGLYAMRGGLPQLAHGLLGEVISPNLVLPQWLDDGITDLLYGLYTGKDGHDPFNAAVFSVSTLPDLSLLSNHPGIWPGYYAHRIYGRPFIHWIYERYGWDALLAFMSEHGAGIIPIEIDLKARHTLGKTWVSLWNEFRETQAVRSGAKGGRLIDGFWPEPFIYWNIAGVFPGMDAYQMRGRYGYVDRHGTLWISEYDSDDIAVITGYLDGVSIPCSRDHIWDPGAGDIAVSREGHRPVLVPLQTIPAPFGMARIRISAAAIPGPPEAIALSGPVRSASGAIAVAANIAGNWDIWVYEEHDRTWRRITDAPSIEMDPWWHDTDLVFSSNASGIFQICQPSMTPLTTSAHAAIMPRMGQYLELREEGWQTSAYAPPQAAASVQLHPLPRPPSYPTPSWSSRPYAPWSSILPNFVVPDIYVGESDLQIGLATLSRDVSKDYTTDAGVRYSFHDDYLSLRLGGRAKHIGLQGSRYPLSYDSNLGSTDESRMEAKVAYIPFLLDPDLLELSLHRLAYEPMEGVGWKDLDLWGAVHFHKVYGNFITWGTFESYSGGRQSLYGGVRLRWGTDIYGVVEAHAGKTWDGYAPGHGTFRIGGDVGEGYFTQRPSRLFPLRGFSSNLLEASQAFSTGVEIYWPLINLQRGYETLPLFFHKLRLGTFVDSGACRNRMSSEDLLVGAGIELITSMELAWGNLSSFHMGIAWPVRQPDYLDENGPVLLLQIGRPL
ncbi:MAG: hypothetical protein ABFD81_05410 [Syntrophaceae bacterium]